MHKYCMFFIGLLIILPGCAKRTIRVESTALADTTAIPRGFDVESTFVIVPPEPNNLQTKEITKKISLLLENKGHQVNQSQEADYYLCFEYGNKNETKVLNVPKYIPGPTTTSIGAITNDYQTVEQYNTLTQTSGTTVYVQEQHTFYNKFINWSVYDTKEALDKKPNDTMAIWHGTATNNDENPDMRWTLDYLLVELSKLFGKNTIGYVSKDINYDYANVKQLRVAYLGSTPKTRC